MSRGENTQGPGGRRSIPIYRDWTVLQLGALVFLLDQFTKYLVIQLLPFRSSFPAEGFFRFTHTHNTGSAFGIFQGQNTPLIFISFVGIIILVLIYRSQPRPSNWLRLSLGLQLGGAFGNLVDRLRLGHVTDFIDIGLWPVFNLADASIVTGLVLLAWVFLWPARKEDLARDGEPARGQARWESHPWCPVCDGDMMEVSNGWRCIDCGVREWIDSRGVSAQEDGEYISRQTGGERPSNDGCVQSSERGGENQGVSPGPDPDHASEDSQGEPLNDQHYRRTSSSISGGDAPDQQSRYK